MTSRGPWQHWRLYGVSIGKNIKEIHTVGVAEENVVLAVSAIRDATGGMTVLNARFSGHLEDLQRQTPKTEAEPRLP